MVQGHSIPVVLDKNALNPQIKKDLEQLELAQMRAKEERQEILKLAAMLHSMKDPMLGVQELMMLMMNGQGDQVAGLAAADNLDSDLRTEIGSGQSETNWLSNYYTNHTTGTDPSGKAAAFLKEIQQLEAFIKGQEALGSKSSIDPSVLNNLKNAIGSIKEAFGKSWGDPTKMANQIMDWVQNVNDEGMYPAGYQNMMNGLQTLNQTTSAMSATTNTQLQFTTEQFKQFMGIDETVNKAWLSLTSTSVRNQRAG